MNLSKYDNNKAQLDAVLYPIQNLLISAGAGSGKTTVLTDRIIKQILDGKDILSFLIVTFTEEAAKEMKTRIKNGLKKEGSFDILPYIDIAHIETYDAFRLYILRKYGHEIGLNSNVSIITEDIVSVKVHQIIKDIIDEEINKCDPTFKEFVFKYCSKSYKNLETFIYEGYKKYKTVFDKEKFINSFYDKFLTDNYFNKILDNILNLLIGYTKQIKEELSRAESDKVIEVANIKYGHYFEAKTLKDFMIENNNKKQWPKAPTLSDTDKYVINRIKAIEAKIDEINCFDLEIFLNYDIKDNQKFIPYLLELVKKTYDLSMEFKIQNGMMEFSDIEIFTNQLVNKYDYIREDLKKEFKIIMIDEYQDTSNLQEEFVSKFANNNLFVVGDMKQAIYRFRGANPDIFLKKYNDYKNQVVSGDVIDMNTNYRSREEVTSYINELFSKLMTTQTGGINYALEHNLTSGSFALNSNKITSNSYGFSIIHSEFEDEKLKEDYMEAHIIISDIRNKIENHFQVYDYDLKGFRDVKYSDFAILSQVSTHFDTFREEFNKYGIPLNIDKDEEIKEDIVILTLKSVLNLINLINSSGNIEDIKYYTVSVLRSFIFKYGDQKIYDLVSKNELYNDENYLKIVDIANKVKNLNLSQSLNLILKELTILDKVAYLGNGLKYLTKLNAIYEKIETMNDLSYDLSDFIKYLEDLNTYDIKFEVKIRADSNDAVTLQTIHKSKGLQYKIVYFIGLNNSFKGDKDKYYINNENGYYLNTLCTKEGSLFKKVFNIEENKRMVEEKVRLLYVALTRVVENGYFVVAKTPKTKREIFSVYDCKNFMHLIDFLDTNYINVLLNDKISIKTKNNVEKDSDFEIKSLNLNVEEIVKNKASKELKLNLEEDKEKLRFGTHIHLLFEAYDIKNPNFDIASNNIEKKYLTNFSNLDLIKKAKRDGKIYKEYEYYDVDNNIDGIIDLMIVYDDYIDILDYKLKNIGDDNYKKQLGIYKNYIEKTFKKNVNTYLYSIIENEILKVE